MKGVFKPILFISCLLTVCVVASDSAEAKKRRHRRAYGTPVNPQSLETTKNLSSDDDLGKPIKEVLDGQKDLDKNILEKFKLFSDQPGQSFDNITSVPVKCFASSPMAGVPACDDKGAELGFKNTIMQMVRQKLVYKTEAYYKGETVDWLTGERNKVSMDKTCNLSYGEANQNYLSENCGGHCQFKISVGFSGGSVSVSGCERERAWFRGAHVQAMNFYKERVFDEFKNNTLAMTDFQGPRPCAPIGADIMRFQDGNQLMARKFQMNMGEDALFRKCESKQLETNSFMGRNDHVASQAVCDMKDLQTKLHALWATLLTCEIHARVNKDHYEQANNVNGWVAAASGQIISPCKKSVCKLCSEDTRNRRVNSCYQGKITNFVQQQLKRYETKEPLEMPLAGRVPASASTK